MKKLLLLPFFVFPDVALASFSVKMPERQFLTVNPMVKVESILHNKRDIPMSYKVFVDGKEVGSTVLVRADGRLTVPVLVKVEKSNKVLDKTLTFKENSSGLSGSLAVGIEVYRHKQ